MAVGGEEELSAGDGEVAGVEGAVGVRRVGEHDGAGVGAVGAPDSGAVHAVVGGEIKQPLVGGGAVEEVAVEVAAVGAVRAGADVADESGAVLGAVLRHHSTPVSGVAARKYSVLPTAVSSRGSEESGPGKDVFDAQRAGLGAVGLPQLGARRVGGDEVDRVADAGEAGFLRRVGVGEAGRHALDERRCRRRCRRCERGPSRRCLSRRRAPCRRPGRYCRGSRRRWCCG